MLRIVKSIEKSYCLSCGKHLPDNLWNIEIKVSNFGKGTDVCGMCENCLIELSNIIQEKYSEQRKVEIQ